LLWAIVDQAAADSSTRDTDVATDPDADPARFTERTASKIDFGTRAEPVDGGSGVKSETRSSSVSVLVQESPNGASVWRLG
jgi:hypothetical protein